MSVILVVARDSEQIARTLRQQGLAPFAFSNADEALRTAAVHPPQLVLAEMSLPGALKLLGRFCRAHGGPGAVALVEPGQEEVPHADACLSIGTDGGELARAVSRLLPMSPDVLSGEAPDRQLTSADIFGDVLAEVEADVQRQPSPSASDTPQPSQQPAPSLSPPASQPTTESQLAAPNAIPPNVVPPNVVPPPVAPSVTAAAQAPRARRADDDIDRKLEETLSGVLPLGDRLSAGNRASAKEAGARSNSKKRADAEIDDLLDKTLSSLELPSRARKARRTSPAEPATSPLPQTSAQEPPVSQPAAPASPSTQRPSEGGWAGFEPPPNLPAPEAQPAPVAPPALETQALRPEHIAAALATQAEREQDQGSANPPAEDVSPAVTQRLQIPSLDPPASETSPMATQRLSIPGLATGAGMGREPGASAPPDTPEILPTEPVSTDPTATGPTGTADPIARDPEDLSPMATRRLEIPSDFSTLENQSLHEADAPNGEVIAPDQSRFAPEPAFSQSEQEPPPSWGSISFEDDAHPASPLSTPLTPEPPPGSEAPLPSAPGSFSDQEAPSWGSISFESDDAPSVSDFATRRLPTVKVQPVEEGQDFGEYTLLERIAVGGMAEVWKARRRGVEGFRKNVAIKRILSHLTSSEDFISMFVDEAKLAAQLTHNNIIQIYDLGKQGEDFFIAMELVDGKDLRTILKTARDQEQRLPQGLALMIAGYLARALDYAHRKKDFEDRELGLVHRDVSPQNVLISYEGEIKLCDFGIAKAVVKASTTQMGALKGKLQYMSPEQAWGKAVDPRSDIFSAGAVIFEMLTGTKLFTGDSEISVLDAVRECRVQRPREVDPSISEEVEHIVLKALAKEPRERYATAGDMADAIERVLRETGLPSGQSELASYMHRVFQAPSPDGLISESPTSFEPLAQTAPPAPPVAEAPLETLTESGVSDLPQPTDETATTTDEAAATKTSSGRKWLWIVFLLAMLGTAAAAWWWIFERADSAGPKTPAASAPAARAPTESGPGAATSPVRSPEPGATSSDMAGPGTASDSETSAEDAEESSESDTSPQGVDQVDQDVGQSGLETDPSRSQQESEAGTEAPAEIESLIDEQLSKREAEIRQSFEDRKKALEDELAKTREAARDAADGTSAQDSGGDPDGNEASSATDGGDGRSS